MKFPSINIRKSRLASFAIAIAAVVTIYAFPAMAQKTDANPSVSLSQCQNGPIDAPAACGDAPNPKGWVTGSSGPPHAHWKETDFAPYRALFEDLPADGTVHTFIIGYDIYHQGVHAIDYLGTYNWTETNAMGNNPCWGVSLHDGPFCDAPTDIDGDDQAMIPIDPLIPTLGSPYPVMTDTGRFTIWGGAFTGPCTYVGGINGGVERQIQCTFTSYVDNPVIAWSGHIAWQGEWGPGNSAGNISGNPYHMRLISLDGQGGNQDLALSANAVSIPAKITVVKDAVARPGFDASGIGFNFTASSNFGLTAFTLYDDENPNTPGHFQDSSTINSFGVGNEITITEGLRAGWGLDALNCSGSLFSATTDIVTRQAVVTVQEGATVTCTFVNGQLAPSAAPASVSGRVATSSGRGISGAIVSIHNTDTGESFTRMTNTFGYYRFNDLPVSSFYVMTVVHKRYLFMDASRSFTLDDDMFGVDFITAEDK